MPAEPTRNPPEQTHQPRKKLGSELAEIARLCGGMTLDIERDKTPASTVEFD